MKIIKQVHNCKIKLDDATHINYFGNLRKNPNYNKYAVYSPDGRCLEVGLTMEEAIEYCKNNF